jgi:hypothetical protein
MKCPHCEKEIPGFPCPKCGETVFETANYCMACGAPLKEDLQDIPQRDDVFEEDSGFDPDERTLCPDGTCTGIIIDGKCTECGRIVGEDGAFVGQEKEPAGEENPSDGEPAEKKID